MGFFDNDLSDSEEFFILEEYDEQLKREQAELDSMLEGHDSLLYDDEDDDDHFFDDRDNDDEVLSSPTPSAPAPDNSSNAPTPDKVPEIINTPKDNKQIMKERTRPLAYAFGVPLALFFIYILIEETSNSKESDFIILIFGFFFVRFLIKRSR